MIRHLHVARLAAAVCVVLTPALLFAQETRPHAFEKDIVAFEAQDAANPPAKGGIEFYGSSSIRFWKTDEDFPDLKILNRGFGGSQAADALYFADRMVIKYAPRLVVYYEGDNDLSRGKTPQEVFGDMKAFFEKVHAALPDTKFIYVCIKPSIQRWEKIDKIRETNGLVRDYAKDKPYITYFDVEPLMLDADGKPKPELFIEDGLHLSPAGYALWNEKIRPLLTAK